MSGISSMAVGFDYPMVPPVSQEPKALGGESQAAGTGASNEFSAPVEVAAAASARPVEEGGPARPKEEGSKKGGQGGKTASGGSQDYSRLSSEEQAQVRQLAARDQEVRAHEQAHLAAGGRYVRGGARYQYQTGPDGKRYAVGGEVSIDSSEEASPEATLRKARAIKRAALAPAQPSGQDRQVAAQASQMEREAKLEQAEQEKEQAEAGYGREAQGQREGEDLFPDPSQAFAPPPYAVRANPLDLVV